MGGRKTGNFCCNLLAIMMVGTAYADINSNLLEVNGTLTHDENAVLVNHTFDVSAATQKLVIRADFSVADSKAAKFYLKVTQPDGELDILSQTGVDFEERSYSNPLPGLWTTRVISNADIGQDVDYSLRAATTFGDGPNPEGVPVADCLANAYDDTHVVFEGSNGRFTATGISGSHRFDATDVVFDGFNDNGYFVPWPTKINAIDVTQFSRENGTLIEPSVGESHHNYAVTIPAGVAVAKFLVDFRVADPGNKLYMKLTDPDQQGTFFNHPTNSFESAIISNPKSGNWTVRVAIKASAQTDSNYLLMVDGGAATPASGCWYGGQINGAWDENGTGVEWPGDGLEVTWEDPFHHSGVMTIEADNFLIENVSAFNHGDGIRSMGDNNIIDGVYLNDIHDDCVENDRFNNLLVTDSFFDGCYVGFSARSFNDSGHDGSDNVFEIRDTLVRLEPQPTVYKPEVYGEGPGHGQFFKWDSNPEIAIKLSVHNTIFLATQGNRHNLNDGSGLGVEEISNLESCSNNVMVWTGEGEFPNAENLPNCFRITKEIAQWDAAVADWYARHQDRSP